MGYSGGMETTTAPDLTPGYPSNGAKLGPAWKDVWRTLGLINDFTDGRALAGGIAPEHDLSPSTLVALLSRAAKAGLLDRESRSVGIQIRLPDGTTRASSRKRTHYRIKAS